MNVSTKKIVMNSLSTAVVAGLATAFVLGEYDTVSYYGMSLSSPVATGIGCGVGSVISDLTSEMVIKKLMLNNQLVNGSTLAVKAGLGGVASAAVLYGGGVPMSAIGTAFVVGAGSKLGGDYANEKLFDPVKGFISLPF